MSTFTEYLKKPQSVLTDAIVAICVGAVASFVFNLFLGFLPFAVYLTGTVGGIVGAVTHMRARDNLNKQPPKFL